MGNISYSFSIIVAAGCVTALCESDDIKLPRNLSKFCEFRELISVKFVASIVLLFAKFRVWRTVVVDICLGGTKIRLRTKVEYCSSTFDELFMRGSMKETRPKA